MSARATTVLVISRQLGSGGVFVGRAVAGRCGMAFVDREILQSAARTLDLAEGEVELREERAASVWDRVLGAFALSAPEGTYVPLGAPPLYEEELFRVESRIIRETAARTDVVIVGRGGFHVLAGHPGLVSVALRADRDWRIRRVMELSGLDLATAAARVDSSDNDRARFIRTFTGHDWNDLSCYDLCLDTSKVGLDLAARLVTEVVAARQRRVRNGGTTTT